MIGDRGKKLFEPTASINGVIATRDSGNTLAATNTGTFKWTITVPTAEVMKIRSTSGASMLIKIIMEAPAVVSDLVIVNNPSTGDFYPPTQTEVKSTDSFFISFTTDKEINSVIVVGSEAGAPQTINISPTTVVTNLRVTCGSLTITPQAKPIQINTSTIEGAISTIYAQSVNDILCNNIHPTLNVTSVDYPTGQFALKDSELATVNMYTSDLDTISYVSPKNDISIQSPSLDESTKLVTRISGDYNDSVDNFVVSATRIANGSTTTIGYIVVIANVPPSLTIAEPSPMKSGGNDGTSLGNYTVTITQNQLLLLPPTTSVPQGTMGNFSLASVYSYTATLSVSDIDPKGTFIYGAPFVTGLSGLSTTVFIGETDYTFEGIKTRNIAVPPFASTVTVNASINNPQNVTVSWDFTGRILTYNVNDILAPNEFTIINITATSFDIKLLDLPNVAASSQQSNITVEY